MCGFVGAIRLDEKFKVTRTYLETMRDTMVHRGPDGYGTWVSPDHSIGLAHRRLSIIDLSEAASQPMANTEGSIQVVFNGEIYNHAELREQLNKVRNIHWQTDHSDTEVIIHAYETWGIDCLHHFRGMFAIGIWDGRTRDLWLVRDRIGIKPLYWSTHHGRLTFGSEIKALLADPEQVRSVDEDSISDYLAFICVPAPRTMFKGVNKLPSGCLIRVRSGGHIEQRRWYEIWDHINPNRYSNSTSVYDQVFDVLSEAIKYRKVSDVPVGVFLSGGVDSSANALLFSQDRSEPVRTFSIGYDGDYRTYTNELPFAKLMAERVGSVHYEYLLKEKDLIDFVPYMVHLQDEPIADPVCVPLYYVSKLARDNNVKVCQVGEGADELFWGYRDWRHWLHLQKITSLTATKYLSIILRYTLGFLGKKSSRVYDALGRSSKGCPVFWSSAQGPTLEQRNALLGESLQVKLAERDGWECIEPIWQRFQAKAVERSSLNWMTFVDLSLRLPELLLMRVDKMSMGTSLEARVPFLDHKLVELALSLPQSIKTRKGENKHVLKQTMRGRLPDSIIDRPKRGFGVPIDEWLDGILGKHIERELGRFCHNTGYFQMKGVKSLLSGKSRVRVWYLYNFALWHKHFIERVHRDNLLN